jgi:hypothetical protein
MFKGLFDRVRVDLVGDFSWRGCGAQITHRIGRWREPTKFLRVSAAGHGALSFE